MEAPVEQQQWDSSWGYSAAAFDPNAGISQPAQDVHEHRPSCGATCQFRPGDWLMLRGQHGGVLISQCIKVLAQQDGDKDSHLLQVCQYLLPEDTQHPASSVFWPDEVFKTRELSYHLCHEVISRCFVLHLSQYQRGRPQAHLWQPTTPLYVCEKRYSLDNPLDPFQPIIRWKDIPESEMNYFERPVELERVTSPFLRGVTGRGRLLTDIEVAILSAQGSNTQQFEVPTMEDHKRQFAPPVQYTDDASPTKQEHRQKRQRVDSQTQYLHYGPGANGVHAQQQHYDSNLSAFDVAASLNGVPELSAPPPGRQHNRQVSNKGIPTLDPTNEHVGKPAKPPYSYASLIAQAIWNKPERRCRLEEIYEFVSTAYPWYQTTTTSWQNMLRHNLSLRPCFVKVPRTGGVGKGNWWTLDLDKEPGGFDGLSFGSRRVVAAGNRQLAAEATTSKSRKNQSKRSRTVSHQEDYGDEEEEQPMHYPVPSTSALPLAMPVTVPSLDGSMQPHLQGDVNGMYPVPHLPISHQVAPRPLNGQQRPALNVSVNRPGSSDSEAFESSPARLSNSVSPLLGSFSSAGSGASATSAETHAVAMGVQHPKPSADFFSQLGFVQFANPQRAGPRSSQQTSHEREPMPTSEDGRDGEQGNLDLIASVCQLVSKDGEQQQQQQQSAVAAA